MSIRALYLKSGIISGLSKILIAFTAFLVIWVINEIVGKSGYGHFSIVFSLYFIIAMGIGSAFRALMVYHGSREDTHEPGSKSYLIASTLLTAATISGCAIGLTLFLLADFLWPLWGKEDLIFWLQIMAPLIPAQIFNYVLTSWYQAQQKVPTMVLYMETIPALFRLVLLVLAVFLFSTEWIIGIAFIASYALPALYLFMRSPLSISLDFSLFKKSDFSYGFDSALNQFVNKSAEHITIVLLGTMTSAAVVAEFSLAYRFAQFLMLPKLALGQLLMPRLGQLMHKGDKKQIAAEYDLLRLVTTIAVFCGCIAFCLFGSPVLGLIGPYESAYPVLLLLSAAALLRTVYGDSGSYLPMAGYVRWGLVTNVMGLITLLIMLYILVPFYDNIGAALSIIISIFVAMSVKAYGIYTKDRYNTLNFRLYGICLIGIVVMYTIGEQYISIYWGSGVLTALLIIIGILNHRIFLSALRTLS